MNDKDKKCCEECAVWDTYSENTYCAKSICPCHQEKKGWEERLRNEFNKLIFKINSEPTKDTEEVSGWVSLDQQKLIEDWWLEKLETTRKERDECICDGERLCAYHYDCGYKKGWRGFKDADTEGRIASYEEGIEVGKKMGIKERDEWWRNRIAGVRGYSLLKQDATKEEILEELYKLLNKQ